MSKTVIGLEIHIELNTESKMFCSCFNSSKTSKPNENICVVCLGYPGTLPVANKKAIEKTIKAGLALNCNIPEKSFFCRKSYFYPDLPKGYQITQDDNPLCQNGFLYLNKEKIRIRRIHLEEDAGKLIHPKDKEYSLVDFNRAGVPLMELVTEPDIRSAKDARVFAEDLRAIMKYLNISNCDMEKGEMRVDANVSISSSPGKIDGNKVEIKNINSFKSIEKALLYEIKRQKEIIEKKEKVIRETRGWDDKKEITIPQRSKEEVDDYRYFPEPDLPGINLKEINIEEIKSTIPELPKERKIRFQEKYNLTEKEIDFFITNKKIGDYYEEVVDTINYLMKEGNSKKETIEYPIIFKLTSNYILNESHYFIKNIDEKDLKIRPKKLAEFIFLIYEKKISTNIAKKVIKDMMVSGRNPSDIIKDKNFVELSDGSKIDQIIESVVKNNSSAVKDYTMGKQESLQFLIGQVMKTTKGSANPLTVKKALIDKIS